MLIFVSSFAISIVIYNADIKLSLYDNLHEDDDSMGSDTRSGQVLLDTVFFVVCTAVFGDKTYYSPGMGTVVMPTRTMNTFLYMFLMIIVNIILLNLLIAIMADSYAQVQKYAQLGALAVWLLTNDQFRSLAVFLASSLSLRIHVRAGHHYHGSGAKRSSAPSKYSALEVRPGVPLPRGGRDGGDVLWPRVSLDKRKRAHAERGLEREDAP